MSLTPEDRQRIYEEEKARIEAQARLKSEEAARKDPQAPASERSERSKWKVGCLASLGVLFGLWLIGTLMSPTSKEPTTSDDKRVEAGPERAALMSKNELLKNIGTMTAGLQEMKTGIAGESMEHIKLSLELFNAAAILIQRAQLEELTPEERGSVAELRRQLSLRQRQALPVIRDKVGPIFSQGLWMADSKARTFGERFTTVEFVSPSFVTNANIAKAHLAIHAALVRMRFKRAQYKWYSGQDEYSYYDIDSPTDGSVAVIDLEGNVVPVPE